MINPAYELLAPGEATRRSRSSRTTSPGAAAIAGTTSRHDGHPGPTPSHSHGHSHGRGPTVTGSYRRALTVVLLISLGIAIAEVVGAIVTGALVLFADAAHMAADAAGIGLSLLAAWFASRPATDRRTFGYARAEILAAMANALLLLAMAGVIFAEAVRRLTSPPAVSSGLLIAFGVGALAANACSLLVLRRGQAESLNVRGAFLEVAADTLGAAAVIVTGIIISATGFTLADPIASLAVGALILPRTWRLLREAIDILLEASPEGIDLDDIRRHMARAARHPRGARAARLDDHLRAAGVLGARRGRPGDHRARPERHHAGPAPGLPARALRRGPLDIPARAGRARRPRAAHARLAARTS